VRPLRRIEYEVLVEQGMFGEGEHVQLLDGELVEMSPQGAAHAAVVESLTELLVPALLGKARVRVQLPFAAGDASEPEPDVAVVSAATTRHRHPDSALLVIEVADISCLSTSGGRRASTRKRGSPSTGSSGRLVIPPAGSPIDDDLVRALRDADQR